jgi:hypothetical protein
VAETKALLLRAAAGLGPAGRDGQEEAERTAQVRRLRELAAGAVAPGG